MKNTQHHLKPILGNQYGPGASSRVCVLLFNQPILGNHQVTVPGPRVSSRATQGGTHPRLSITDVTPHPAPPYTTWGGRILTLHLNYVAGYNDPILCLSEQTQ